MNWNIIRFELRLSRFGALCCGLSLLAFQCLIVAFYAAARPDETLTGLFKLVPKGLKALIGGDYLDPITVSGFLSFGFTHPVNLLLLITPIEALASRTASGGTDEGRTDLHLSQPVSRASFLASRIAAGAIVSVLLVLFMWLGHLLGALFIPLPETPVTVPFVYVALNALFFVLAVEGIAFLAAAASTFRGTAVGIAIGLLAAMLFVRLAAQFWDLFDRPAALSVFTYYVPGKVVFLRSFPLGDMATLFAFFLVTSGLALTVFSKKDI